MRRGHLRRRLPQAAVFFAHGGRSHDFGQREPGTQRKAGPDWNYRFFQAFDPVQGYERCRRLLPALHIGQEIGAAGNEHAARPFACKYARGFRHAGRRLILEPRQAHHDGRASDPALHIDERAVGVLPRFALLASPALRAVAPARMLTRPPFPASPPVSWLPFCFRCRRRLRPAAARTSARHREHPENGPAPRADSCLRASGAGRAGFFPA